MLKRIIARAAAIIIGAASTVTMTFPLSAASVEWDGKSELKNHNTYTVTKELTVNKAFTVPKDAKLHVLGGGNLRLTDKSAVTVYGEFGVDNDAQTLLSGKFVAKPSSSVIIYGDFLASLSSQMDISSDMTVFSNGALKTSGVFKLYKKGVFSNRGEFTVLKSGSATLSGKLVNTKNGAVSVHGGLSVTASGTVSNSGSISVTNNATVKNSGLVTLEKSSYYNSAGDFKNTKSGKLNDKRTGANYEAMTAFAVEGEPSAEIHGIDVSRWQGEIDWEKVAASGAEFVMIRAAVGAVNGEPVSADRNFHEYVAGAKGAGLEVGAYMYSYAKTVSEIKAEAKFLVKLLKDYEITYPVVLDMEEPLGYYKDDVSKMAEAFLQIVMDADYFPMVYSSKSWLENYFNPGITDKYAVWLAQWNNVPTYGGNFYMWQYTNKGRVTGIIGDVDLNIAYRDFAAFIKKNRLNKL